MANLNLGQDVANKREIKYTAAHIVAKSYPLYLAEEMRRYGSLIYINPSGSFHVDPSICPKQNGAAIYIQSCTTT